MFLQERRVDRLLLLCFVLAWGLFSRSGSAQTAQFDLQGPTLEIKVQRAGKTLPVAQVPTLEEGDRLWLHPVLGDHESVHYLMVAVFLRGSTNPPPDNWFNKVEAWNKQVMEEGVYLVVPPGADQAVVLFAPETGGDFSTLKNAVRGRPGAFVRATQDLTLASEDRERINVYLDSIRAQTDPDKLKDESNTLARSLSLKLNQDCFTRPADQQAPCLQQSRSAIVLDNGSSSTAQGLLNGPTSDLALQAASTSATSAALYDPYIAAAFDIGRLLASFHSAQFQYIPALASDSGVDMNLWLNAPPSFHNPKSVLVVALPPVHKADMPTLHPVDPKQVFCMQRSPLILPVDGEPTIFSTQYAHGMTLHLQGASGKALDLPTEPDAAQGGFVVPAPVLLNAGLGTDVEATVHGYWGFDPYIGPSFKLRSTEGSDWTVADADRNALVVGRDDDLHLRSDAAACVDTVLFRDAAGKEEKATWKPDGADGIIATLPLKDKQPGAMTLEIKQVGLPDAKTVKAVSFAEAGKYDTFMVHAGDLAGVLTGTRLDQVAKLTLRGVAFTPGKLGRQGTTDTLELASPDGAAAGNAGSVQAGSTGKADGAAKSNTAADSGVTRQPTGTESSSSAPINDFTAGAQTVAEVTLKDGRAVPVPVTVSSARPSVSLINKNVQLAAAPPASAIALKLGAPDELPLDGQMTFALRSETPATFAKGESIEVATEDGLASVTFSLLSGELVLQDAKTAIGTLDPGKSFGASAFGPLRLRPVMADGTTGDWVSLATLVRLPQIQGYSCPADAAQSCTLSGSSLFLLGEVAADAQFSKPVTVPEGFAASTLDVPRAANGQLFLKLRDDPSVVNTVIVDPGSMHAGYRRAHRAGAAGGDAALAKTFPPPGGGSTKTTFVR